MKKQILLIALVMLIACNANTQQTNKFYPPVITGAYNFIYYSNVCLTTASYCVAVGEDTAMRGKILKDMYWFVDWGSQLLLENYKVRFDLKFYDECRKGIKGFDNPGNRVKLQRMLVSDIVCGEQSDPQAIYTFPQYSGSH